MKVKIGNEIHDSKDEPIMIILSDKDKENITNMDKNCTKYCCFADNIDIKDIENFMKD